ncbi:MFS general substrate transporter [Xylariaceae sp. FL0016]|nr:MFS general substrate transporter [Xylariaceae sp. FL0016]
METSSECLGEKLCLANRLAIQSHQAEVKSTEKTLGSRELVSWEDENDPDNPRNWSPWGRWGNVGLVSMITILTPLASSALAPAVPDMMDDFHDDSSAMASLVVSAYVVGFALGPLVTAPLSEAYGRLIIYHVSSVLFLAFTVGCALSTSSGMFVAFRLLAGCAGATPMVLGGGTIADLIPSERRGAAMTIWGGGQLFGPVIGPVAGGYLNEAAGWKWVFWTLLIFGGITTTLGLIFMRETYEPVLLARKAKRLRHSTGDSRYLSQHDLDYTSISKQLRDALVRPMQMLFTSSILFILCVNVSIVYGYLYLVFTTSTSVYERLYGFSSGEAGLTFLGIGIGMLIGLISVGFASDKLAAHIQRTREIQPEDRLPPLIPGAFLIPVGLFWYGWALRSDTFWLVSLLGMGFFGAGIIATFVPIQMYLIEAFKDHAASALAALATMRSVVGATLPLAGGQMYDTLGLAWGNSLMGFVALALTPVPFLLMRYGARLRKSSLRSNGGQLSAA